MDTDNAPDIVIADGLAPPDGPLAQPARVRWRQRVGGRSRAAPAATPETPRALITLRPSGRMAAPPVTDRSAGDPDPSHPPATGDAAPAMSGQHHDPAGPPRDAGATRGVVHAGPTEGPDIPLAAAGVRDAADANPLAETPSGRDLADDGGAAPRTDRAGEAVQEPQAGSALPDEPEESAAMAGTDPQRAPRDVELWLLARRAQGAALQLDFELRTAPARQVFRRDFVYVSRQLHALEGSRRVQGLDRTRLNDALATLRQRANTIQAFMQQRAAELRAAVAARGPAGAHIAFARPARFQATIVSPGAHRFLGLVMQADDTLAVLEMAWLLGLVEPATRAALVSDCRRALLGFKDLACDLRHAVGLLVQELNAQRRAGHAAPSGD